MAFQTNLEIEKLPGQSAIPLTPIQIKRAAVRIEALCRTHPKTKSWVKTMGARADSWSILFCDDREMRAFQKKYRKLDRTTDVLSFPTIENTGLRGVFAKLPRGSKSLGDVVVSMPAVSRGARRGRRSDAEELLEVLIHAFLHLLGFDHVVGDKVRRADAVEMRKFQKKIFSRLRVQMKL